MATARRRDNYKLAAVDFVSRGWRIAAPGQFCGPQFLAGVFVKRADFSVLGSGAKDQPARGHNCAAVIFRTGPLDSLRRKFGILAERHFPEQPSRIEVKAVERAPRRLVGGVSVLIIKFWITGGIVFWTFAFWRLGLRGTVTKKEKIHQRLCVSHAQIRVCGH